ncbi:MAG: ATP-binding cassette domain-containing protein, partial [Imperialibacter sp.]
NKPSGRHVIQLTDVSKSYGDLVILKNTNAHIERGDKIALIGANGKGKSTLLRIIAGTDKVNGKREEGYNVIKSFYAQHQLEALNIEYEILEEMKASGTDKTEMQLRSVLGCFLFSDEDVFKKIKVLSGGEKSRVALAKTLISEANFLLLDEPTNHLDIQSVNILIQALQQYEGTFIVVSHDRYFVTEIANKIWYIENNEIKEYPGTYEEYMWWKEKQAAVVPSVQPQVKKEEPKPKPAPSQVNNLSMETQKELKALRKKMDGIENEILETELKIEEAEKELASPEVFESPDALAQSNEKYQLIKAELERLNDQWEETGIKIEELEKQLA